MAVEALTLDGLSLNSYPSGSLLLLSLSMPPPRKKPEWAESADGDGALLVRDPLFENRTIEATVEARAASRDAAHTAVGSIVDKLQEASRNPLGIPLVWTPADSTKSLTFYVLSGELNEIPITLESGYFASTPVLAVSLSLTCRPFGYGAEVTVASAAGSGPLQIYSLASVTGDVSAEGRLIVSDTASQSRDFAAWGLEWRYQAGADLLLTQNELTNTGFAGVSSTTPGSVSTNTYRTFPTSSPVAACGTGNQPHVGTFRVYGRFWPDHPSMMVRFSYRDGDGPLKSLDWELVPAQDTWVEMDLGVITIPPKTLGTQRWQGQIEVVSDGPPDAIEVDYLLLVPAGEGFGRARRTLAYETPQVFSARDEFDQTAGALAGKTLPVGGTWAGAGDADDFTVNATAHTLQRTATGDVDVFASGRFALAGASTYATIAVQADVTANSRTAAAGPHQAVFARYVDVNNYLAASLYWSGGWFVELTAIIGAASFSLGTAPVSQPTANTWNTLRVQVDASGRAYLWYDGRLQVSGSNAQLATGGTLATGRIGVYDYHGAATAITRSYDNFTAFVPLDNAVCFSGQSIEFRSDDTLREDLTGTYYGRPQEYRGAPFYVPPAGDENRTSRVAVMLRRNDPYTLTSAQVSDNQSVQVAYTPRYLAVPR